jgi:hypothetical protein
MEDRYCIRCGKAIRQVEGSPDSTLESGCWDGGIVGRITAGYGSAHDMDEFVVAVCDRCIVHHARDCPETYSRPDLEELSVDKLHHRVEKIAHPDGCIFGNTDRAVTDMIRWLTKEFGDLHLEFIDGSGWCVQCCHWNRDVIGSGKVELSLFQALAIAVIVVHEERAKLTEVVL